MSITIKDVAKKAGVSTATVSHILNNSRFVVEETRQRVDSAIRALGYVANSNARGLRSSVSHRIGLIVPEVSDYFPVDIIEPIESVMHKAGYQLILGYTHDNIDMERRQIEFFNYQRIDGLLLFPAIGDHAYLKKMHLDYPIVMLDRTANNFDADCVKADDENAVYEGISLFLSTGRRRIAIILGAEGISTTKARFKGYQRALRDNNIEVDERLVKWGNTSPEQGVRNTSELLDDGIFDALFTTNIGLTIGALQCLLKRGVHIPNDIAMLGWGDSKWTELTNPPLSVLRHPNQEIGSKAAKILLKRIQNRKAPYKEYLLPVGIVRRTSL